jgi:D-erythronate 2-dehydrogenase
MHILILGAAGMIGQKLTAAILRGALPVMRLTLVDVVAAPVPPFDDRVESLALNLTQGVAPLIRDKPDIIFHSAQAEADFDAGYATNLDATRALFEAIRAIPDYRPRVVFASSGAVFGVPFPDVIPDDFHLTPRSSYGTQKAMAELLLADYTRRGFFDGIALRLPTICIRPGLPNAAASGFFSGILREPLAGKRANLPVRDTIRHWFASPRSAVGFFLHAATLDHRALHGQTALNMPGLSATVADQIAALHAYAGADTVALIDRVPDARIAAIVETWAQAYDAKRATALGFTAETDFAQILQVYIDDDM